MATMTLYQQLDDALVTCTLGENTQEFLPLSELNEKITASSVRVSVRAELPYMDYFRDLCLPDDLPEKVCQCAKKVFAILVLIEEPRAIKGLMKEGLTDEYLPLSQKSKNEKNILVSAKFNNREFKSFAVWPQQARVKDFLKTQWVVQAPVFDITGKHIILDRNCPLPCQTSDDISRAGSSVVYKGALHPSHQEGLQMNDGMMQVAIKEFETKAGFLREEVNLRRIEELAHRHLIKLVATCQRGLMHYAMFPWADGGNLMEFWKLEDSRRDEKMLWSLRQMLGLVDALKVLHEQNCRHGDLKPDNVLHFKIGEGTLVLADFGISKFHGKPTSDRHMKTNTTATTRSYEAPEAQPDVDDPRSRLYDMWSMGCIFLEFAIWLLYGIRGVRSFKRSRESIQSTDPMISPGSFYTRDPTGTIELHPKVSEAISTLLEDPRCKGDTALAGLVELTAKDLLLVNVPKRSQASTVYEKLKKIVQSAEKKPGTIINSIDPTPPTPVLFTRAGSRQNSASAWSG